MAQTQKERLKEARDIHARFHNWMGFLVCDGVEDMLALRKLVKKIEREAYKKGYKQCEKQWKETVEILDNPEIMEGLKSAMEDVKAGRYTTLESGSQNTGSGKVVE